MNEALLYHLALTMVPQLGDIQIGILLSHFNDPLAVFRAGKKELEAVPGIGAVRAASIHQFSRFGDAAAEIAFAEKNNIKILVRGTEGYPPKLHECIDAPHVLFYKGTAALDTARILSIVGTRSPTAYGRERVKELLGVLATHGVLVVSGLAYGIDTLAHKAALDNGLQTVGVLAHGLDRIYPSSNLTLAREMLAQGGLLTECWQGTQPLKQHFPKRNRIVAGIADAVVVIESGEKGGSLITADLANGYDKYVMAYPGRSIDTFSKGCNRLIRTHLADLVTCGKEVVDFMKWESFEDVRCSTQATSQSNPLLLNAEEQLLLGMLAEKDNMHIDELMLRSGIAAAAVSVYLFSLEMKGLLMQQPGKCYAVCRY
jgi:DNA processing protein